MLAVEVCKPFETSVHYTEYVLKMNIYFRSSSGERDCSLVVAVALVAPQLLGLTPCESEFKQAWVKKDPSPPAAPVL